LMGEQLQTITGQMCSECILNKDCNPKFFIKGGVAGVNIEI
jgi:hypothetical protein